MTGPALALAALVLAAALAIAFARRPRLAAALAVAGVLAAAALALPAMIDVLAGGAARGASIAWAQPVGALAFGVDPLTALFAIPLLVLAALCAIYGAFYLDDVRGERPVALAAAGFDLLIAAMLLVLLARDAVGFLAGWEVMTVASYLLVSFDHAGGVEQSLDTSCRSACRPSRLRLSGTVARGLATSDVSNMTKASSFDTSPGGEPRRAGWVYLLASHLGVLAILAVFVALGQHAGAMTFAAWSAAPVGGGGAIALTALALAGFGVKAGLAPVHVWLPEAHAAAPSHVSALMSGMLIKLGLYGILRTLGFVDAGAWAGPALVAIGAATAVTGIALALYQRDLKRALAYSSIEHVGVIVLALGVARTALAAGRDDVATLAFAGALLHVWHHAAMKGLLFLGAGAIVHATGTRDLEKLGGLLARMPRAGALLIVGAAAIAALPPLAGFASEWLVYLGLVDGVVRGGAGVGLAAALTIVVLVVVGALAALAFVRLCGVALLGAPRSPEAAHAHDAGAGLLAPIAVLAAAVIALPAIGFVLVPALAPVIDQLAGRPLDVAPAVHALRPIAILSAVVWGAVLVVAALVRARTRARVADDTWGCGYAAPTARMQYTARSFAELAGGLLPRSLRPRVARTGPEDVFPAAGTQALAADTRDPFTRGVYEPFFDRWRRRFARLHALQRGLLHLYVLYILITVVLGLGFVAATGWWGLP